MRLVDRLTDTGAKTFTLRTTADQVIGKKRMPSAAKHERFYAFVDAVSDDMDDLMSGLGAEEYDTKTRGHRHVGAARAVGRGVYELTREYRGVRPHTHLVYRMELPEAGLHHGGGGGETSVGGAVAAESGKDPTAQAAAGTAQAELAILPEGSYVVQASRNDLRLVAVSVTVLQ